MTPNWERLNDIVAPAPEHFTIAIDPAAVADTAGDIVLQPPEGFDPPEWFTPDGGEDITEEEAAQRRNLPPLRKSTRLTARIAIGIAIELWTWIVDTGSDSECRWPGWHKYDEQYRLGGMLNPFCAYANGYLRNRKLLGSGHVRACNYCPYKKLFRGHCNDESTHYDLWCIAKSHPAKKNHAQAFLEELLQLQKVIILNPKSVLPGSQQ